MRITSLLVVAALFTVTGSGCALDGGDADGGAGAPGLASMDEEMNEELGGDPPVKTQAPPIKLKIDLFSTPNLAMVALRDGVGRFDGQLEHWFAPQGAMMMLPLLPQTEGSLMIHAYPLAAETETTLTEFVAPLDYAFASPREVKTGEWNRGLVTVPSGHKPHLFWTAHPDDGREVLGVLLITDPDGKLALTAWYRSTPPDQAGRAFSSTRWSQSLHPVVDARGEPSADPNDIKVTDWYSIVMKSALPTP